MSDEFGRLLQQVNVGDRAAFESLVALVYGELRRMAGGMMRGRVHGATLQPTALVHEAYLRLAQGEARFDGRAHFFGAAARAMRQVIVGWARAKAAEKRGGPGVQRVTFHELDVSCSEPKLDLLALDEALAALADAEPHLARVVELRYFAGCSLPEITELTGRSLASVKRDWSYARAWLYERMTT